MDAEFHNEEFHLGNVVEDIEMSDDELEKELKQLEEEQDEKPNIDLSVNVHIETKMEPLKVKTETRREVITEPKTAIEIKADENSAVKGKSRCAIYDDVDDPPPSNGHNRRGHHHDRRHPHRSGPQFDLKRLNKSLHVTATCDDMVVGREIAYRLNEEKMRLFGHIVRVLGQRTTSDIFAETKDIVNRGGLKTDRGDRMRTPGGTFLYLMKNRGYATPEQIKEIFKEDNERIKKAKKRTREANYVTPTGGESKPTKKKKKSNRTDNQEDGGDNEKKTVSCEDPSGKDSKLSTVPELPLPSDTPPAINTSLKTTTTTEAIAEAPSLSNIADERPPGSDDLEDGEVY